jgi:hypothetical protein
VLDPAQGVCFQFRFASILLVGADDLAQQRHSLTTCLPYPTNQAEANPAHGMSGQTMPPFI